MPIPFLNRNSDTVYSSSNELYSPQYRNLEQRILTIENELNELKNNKLSNKIINIYIICKNSTINSYRYLKNKIKKRNASCKSCTLSNDLCKCNQKKL